MSTHLHRAPADCPVCGDELVTTRLGCASCGSELSGTFERCRFCSLDAAQMALLTTFLASRGNLSEVAKQLQVSHPTARARLSGLLQTLGIEETHGTDQGAPAPAEPAGQPEPAADAPVALTRSQVLAGVADGSLDPATAARLLADL